MAVCQQLMSYLNINKLLFPGQFGFRPKRKTMHVVHKMFYYVTDKSIDNKVTIATFIDLSKAFDSLQFENFLQN